MVICPLRVVWPPICRWRKCNRPIETGALAMVARSQSGAMMYGARYHPKCLVEHIKDEVLAAEGVVACAACGDPVYDDVGAHVLTGKVPCPDEPGGGIVPPLVPPLEE